MLFAKISPTAKAAKQIDALDVSFTECHWMTATTEYRLGQNNTKFQIIFGNFTANPDPNQPAENLFQRTFTVFIDFTSQELSTWGEDDSVVFNIIASKIGTSIIEVADKPEIQSI
jgi:hypothetical protein